MDTKTTSPIFSGPISSGPISSSRFLPAILGIGGSLLIMLAGPGIASAQTAKTEGPAVRYADLDLSTRQGAKMLLVRIEHAANEACGELTHSPLLPREGRDHRVCVAGAVDAAVEQVDAPMLTALRSQHPDIKLAAR